jgi:hypothetical protein
LRRALSARSGPFAEPRRHQLRRTAALVVRGIVRPDGNAADEVRLRNRRLAGDRAPVLAQRFRRGNTPNRA